jgi:superkiller protein 3
MAHNNLGNVLADQKKLDEASACYRKAIELDPKFANAHNNLGHSLYLQRKLDEAITCYRKAIELDPEHAHAHDNLGHLLLDQKELGDAIVCFRRVIELMPKYAKGHFNLGTALHFQGKLDDAIGCYRKAIALDPKYAPAHGNLGAALARKGKLDEAIACHRNALAMAPKDHQWRSKLALLLSQRARSADLTEAITQYRMALAMTPDDAATLNNFAWLLATCPDARFRDPVTAVAVALKAVKLAPKDGNRWNTLGVSQYRAGDCKAAVAALRKSTQLRKGGDAHDWFFLAMAEWQLGNQRQARTWYERGVRWMEQNQRQNLELRRFRTEAEALLGIQPPVEARRPLAARNQRRRPVSARRPKNHSLRITDN